MTLSPKDLDRRIPNIDEIVENMIEKIDEILKTKTPENVFMNNAALIEITAPYEYGLDQGICKAISKAYQTNGWSSVFFDKKEAEGARGPGSPDGRTGRARYRNLPFESRRRRLTGDDDQQEPQRERRRSRAGTPANRMRRQPRIPSREKFEEHRQTSDESAARKKRWNEITPNARIGEKTDERRRRTIVARPNRDADSNR